MASSKSNSPLRRGRSGYREIADALRREILNGTVKPGQLFPTRQRLQERFRTTKVTIQSALDVLAEEGFVRAEGRRGTFVQSHPPHLHDYALVFPDEPCAPGMGLWSRFYAGLVNQAASLSQRDNRRVIPFYGMDNGVNAPEYPRLLKRVQSHRLAGIICASPLFRLEGTPVLDQPGIPRVMFATSQTIPRVPLISLEGSFWPKALDYLAARGRKRIATVTITTHYAEHVSKVRNLVSARGMTLHPCGFMPFDGTVLDGARAYVQLLMQARPEDRPDGLIVSDDNFVEHATAGLIAAGVRVGEELDVVAHCNFPWAGPTMLPLKRLGFDSRTVLQTCIELIDRQRRGETVPPMTTVEAKFEEELQSMTDRGRMAPPAAMEGANT